MNRFVIAKGPLGKGECGSPLGNFDRLAKWVLTLVAALSSAAPLAAQDTILHSFTGGLGGVPPDGGNPTGSLTLSGGFLYGMTSQGGTQNRGTIFSIQTDGSGYTDLHNFGLPGDGTSPNGSLTLSGSKLYGMANGGGANQVGEIFSINTDGSGYGTLYSFGPTAATGGAPRGSLLLSGSKLYGATNTGGTGGDTGTLFSINTDGTGFTLLHDFQGGTSDGRWPYFDTPIISGSKLFGMTQIAGASNDGTIYSVNTDGTGYTILHNFSGGSSDGANPWGSLTQVGSKLFGMTYIGGSDNHGSIFTMNLDGSGFALLHSFVLGTTQGGLPTGSLTAFGSQLYGMTTSGGTFNGGTLFRMNLDGTGFTVVENLNASVEGSDPYGDVTISSDGTALYGMTQTGGTSSMGGTVFSYAIPAPEPGSLTMLIAAAAGLLGLRPRRNH